MSDVLKILVVDDEPGMRSGVTRSLRDFTVRLPDINGEVRFEIDQARTGEEALEKIDAAAPDILLLDHKLPGISGLDVLDRVNKRIGIGLTAEQTIELAACWYQPLRWQKSRGRT